ncbi:MAG: nucleoside deaminase [Bacilli bacterium]|nr:nucleoside deaminase [Bacilli bacterium]HOF53379.1 nucleoside deaminase [Bacilli bacterium]HOR20528.1 nucleoside deaminase [Bacilli bacterium]HPK67230.1 nucleoside deaminase [Bacilli bacterium]
MNKFMRMAINEARKGIHSGHGGPFGSVIVKDGVVVAKGHNQVIKNQDPTCHGEMMAIHKACKKLGTFDLSGCELYTTAEPCPMCLGAILWANISRVYFGCNIVDTEEIGFRDKVFYEINESGKKDEIVIELDRKQCLKLFEEYKNIEDKHHY